MRSGPIPCLALSNTWQQRLRPSRNQSDELKQARVEQEPTAVGMGADNLCEVAIRPSCFHPVGRIGSPRTYSIDPLWTCANPARCRVFARTCAELVGSSKLHQARPEQDGDEVVIAQSTFARYCRKDLDHLSQLRR